MMPWFPVERVLHVVPLVISELHSSGNDFFDREFRRWRPRWSYCSLASRHHNTKSHVRTEQMNLAPTLSSYILEVAGSNLCRDIN
jgi:hypothetical protein